MCSEHTNSVKELFENINLNTQTILSQAKNMEVQSVELDKIFKTTLDDINHINTNVESTAAITEEITASVINLHENIEIVVGGYTDINETSNKLKEVSRLV